MKKYNCLFKHIMFAYILDLREDQITFFDQIPENLVVQMGSHTLFLATVLARPAKPSFRVYVLILERTQIKFRCCSVSQAHYRCFYNGLNAFLNTEFTFLNTFHEYLCSTLHMFAYMHKNTTTTKNKFKKIQTGTSNTDLWY